MTAEPSTDVATTTLVRALNSPRRRIVLSELRREGGTLPIEELAQRVRQIEQTAESDRPSDDVEVTLWHVHLPTLASVGFVEFDADRATAAFCPADESLTASLDRFTEFVTAVGDRHHQPAD